METQPRQGPAGPTWWHRIAALTALLLVGSLLLEGATALDVAAKPSSNMKPLHAEIIGGSPAPESDFSFMALVLAGDSLCGGTVIDSDSVLTAAHCVTDGDGDVLAPASFTLYIGSANIDNVPRSDQYAVTSVFRDPAYNEDTLQNDVAVLKLDRAVTTGAAIPLIGSGSQQNQAPGQSVVVAGWGTTSPDGNISSDLLMADVALDSDATCQADYPGDFDPATMICASFPGRDSCQGDSGGPLLARVQTGTTTMVVKGKKRKGKKRHKKHIQIPVYANMQIGVVSWGDGCAVAGSPGVYVRLSNPGINTFVTTSAAR